MTKWRLAWIQTALSGEDLFESDKSERVCPSESINYGLYKINTVADLDDTSNEYTQEKIINPLYPNGFFLPV